MGAGGYKCERGQAFGSPGAVAVSSVADIVSPVYYGKNDVQSDVRMLPPISKVLWCRQEFCG